MIPFLTQSATNETCVFAPHPQPRTIRHTHIVTRIITHIVTHIITQTPLPLRVPAVGSRCVGKLFRVCYQGAERSRLWQSVFRTDLSRTKGLPWDSRELQQLQPRTSRWIKLSDRETIPRLVFVNEKCQGGIGK